LDDGQVIVFKNYGYLIEALAAPEEIEDIRRVLEKPFEGKAGKEDSRCLHSSAAWRFVARS
jgi:hypothetical protein